MLFFNNHLLKINIYIFFHPSFFKSYSNYSQIIITDLSQIYNFYQVTPFTIILLPKSNLDFNPTTKQIFCHVPVRKAYSRCPADNQISQPQKTELGLKLGTCNQSKRLWLHSFLDYDPYLMEIVLSVLSIKTGRSKNDRQNKVNKNLCRYGMLIFQLITMLSVH